MLYIGIYISTFSFCLRPFSLTFSICRDETIYIYSRFILLQLTFPALFLSFLLFASLFLFFFPSRSFQTSVGEKYIFVHRTKPLSSTLSRLPNISLLLLLPYSFRMFSLSFLFTTSDLKSVSKRDFRKRALKNTYG